MEGGTEKHAGRGFTLTYFVVLILVFFLVLALFRCLLLTLPLLVIVTIGKSS